MNTYKKHLEYNEKERKAKNIVFDPRKLFDPCQIFTDPRLPRQNFDPRQIFMDPRYPCQNFDPH